MQHWKGSRRLDLVSNLMRDSWNNWGLWNVTSTLLNKIHDFILNPWFATLDFISDPLPDYLISGQESSTMAVYGSLRLCSRHLSATAAALRGSPVPLTRPVSSFLSRHQSPARTSSHRWLWSTTPVFNSAGDLEKAKERLSALTEDPGNDVKLKLYALFKQVST